MKKLTLNIDAVDISDDILYEIIILHNLGVSLEDLKYLLAMKTQEF